MAASVLLLNIGDNFENHGLKVNYSPGWKTRGHNATFEPHGVMFHHTASSSSSGDSPALGVVVRGRSDLPGPLCNIHVSRKGVVTMVAAGYAYHAGEGGPWFDIPANSGNRYLVGIEVENNGLGEPWRKECLDSVAMVSAILLKHMNRPKRFLLGHKEWTSRKIDPAGVSMWSFRRRVGRVKL